MAKVKQASSSGESRKIRPALTPDGRENQLISLAMDLVEQRLIDGTASSQETTHFLKLGSSKAVLERDKLAEENKLLRAKTEQIQAQERSEELFAQAIKAFGVYSGNVSKDEMEEDDEYYDY